ncbi:FliM/FliN family flagellar motor C-terminal domain-containing protein [Pseudoduganella namucuonensis]|uniref:Type III flagellar switch regulator (C-ring) FliN C-term n=1 Tax=Pseudoduganella namucuonensis TaxID=1035707 RepID=A0A1I7M496_9BURK|nr:FliM/FliN family flagellar motor C-terminal domain-containing protein [Pseudoduganella namucuonensis]SFV16640.1 Type III flagellar switch regulator (C-ring) FliN C-term [Pseudoduganella namucuonensis]
MQVRPYALLGAAALAAVRGALERAADAWCADWGLPRHQLALTAERAWEGGALHAPAWRLSHAAGEQALWLGWPLDLAPLLQGMLFAPDKRHAPPGGAPARMAQAGAEAALAALAEGLARSLLGAHTGAGAAGDEPPQAVWRHASGAVRVDVRLGKQACTGVLNHAAVLALCASQAGAASPAPLAPLKPVDRARALGHLPLRLQVDAGRAEVGLGSLLALGVGDVIRLDTLADQPLAIKGPDGRVLFGGHLGTLEKTIALEIVRSNSSSGAKA